MNTFCLKPLRLLWNEKDINSIAKSAENTAMYNNELLDWFFSPRNCSNFYPSACKDIVFLFLFCFTLCFFKSILYSLLLHSQNIYTKG